MVVTWFWVLLASLGIVGDGLCMIWWLAERGCVVLIAACCFGISFVWAGLAGGVGFVVGW